SRRRPCGLHRVSSTRIAQAAPPCSGVTGTVRPATSGGRIVQLGCWPGRSAAARGRDDLARRTGRSSVWPARVRHAGERMSDPAADEGVKMIIDCAHYQDGLRQDEGMVPLEQAAARCRQGGFVWLGMLEPSAEELAQVRDTFSLHELAVEDAQSFHM